MESHTFPMVSKDLNDGTVGTTPRSGAFVGQLVGGVVPVEMCDGPGALFVGVGSAIVGEKREPGICSRIDTNLCNCLLLVSTFDNRADRNNGSGANEILM